MDSLLAGLYTLGDKKLQVEAESLAANPLAWIAEHVELEVSQLEYLRNIKDSFMLMFGWSLAAAIVCRAPVNLSYIKEALDNGIFEESCILYKCSFSGDYAEDYAVSSATVNITFAEAASHR